MIEVYPNLYVGSDRDYEMYSSKFSNFAVVHAAKEPYHRQALGYRGRGISSTHPEYLVARRDHRLMLNMVDVDNPDFFAVSMIQAALDFIEEHHAGSWKVLIHCNKGESRAPSLALLYLAAWLKVLPYSSLVAAEYDFRQIYRNYHPRRGIREHIKAHWEEYCSGKDRKDYSSYQRDLQVGPW